MRQALWSDPNDQSAWLYHRWLVGQGRSDFSASLNPTLTSPALRAADEATLRREIEDCMQLRAEEPQCRCTSSELARTPGDERPN